MPLSQLLYILPGLLRRKPIPLEWRRRPGRIYSSCDNGIRPWIPAQLFSRLSIPLDLAPYNLSLFCPVFSYFIFTPSAFAFGTTTLFKKSIISSALTHAIFNTPLSTNHCIPQALLFQNISLSLGPESEEESRIPPAPGSLRKRSRCPPNQKYQVMNKLCFSPLPLEQASSRSSQA